MLHGLVNMLEYGQIIQQFAIKKFKKSVKYSILLLLIFWNIVKYENHVLWVIYY